MKLHQAAIALAVLFGTEAGLAQSAPLISFKSICISDKETGFNWKSGEWVQANFKAGTKLLVQKLDIEAYAARPPDERPHMCKPEPGTSFGTLSTSRGCYLVKEMGAPSSLLSAEMCDEILDKNNLNVVHCRRFSFHPDGRFIQFPSHADISSNPKDDYKDSLALAVGKCSRLSD
ncbi:MAG: hypothetical protein EOO29_01390 [Comamonadaceae bacterium]|nr:MAG: hypothetical protein EOO29_01390 [Comamonadaceae bacterium]